MKKAKITNKHQETGGVKRDLYQIFAGYIFNCCIKNLEKIERKRGFARENGVKWPFLPKVSWNLLTPVQEQTTVCL